MSDDEKTGTDKADAGESGSEEAPPPDGRASDGRAAPAQSPGSGELYDSPAWYPYKMAHDLAEPFIDQAGRVPNEDENGKSKKATTRQLAHLYCVLFSPMWASDDGGRSPFSQTIIELQTALGRTFKPHDPATTAAADAEVHRILRKYYRTTVQQRSQFGDFESKPPLNSRGEEAELQLSREQLVELYHILVAQADVKLLSPWTVKVEDRETGGW
ncbi:hypothetical protein AB3662_17330 [Sorangium cellulosum]|uniref:hypothetical protein n=1 Tax=Sorangium cellulosum TaxID=56 RepID=UPI003D9A2663